MSLQNINLFFTNNRKDKSWLTADSRVRQNISKFGETIQRYFQERKLSNVKNTTHYTLAWKSKFTMKKKMSNKQVCISPNKHENEIGGFRKSLTCAERFGTKKMLFSSKMSLRGNNENWPGSNLVNSSLSRWKIFAKILISIDRKICRRVCYRILKAFCNRKGAHNMKEDFAKWDTQVVPRKYNYPTKNFPRSMFKQ